MSALPEMSGFEFQGSVNFPCLLFVQLFRFALPVTGHSEKPFLSSPVKDEQNAIQHSSEMGEVRYVV